MKSWSNWSFKDFLDLVFSYVQPVLYVSDSNTLTTTNTWHIWKSHSYNIYYCISMDHIKFFDIFCNIISQWLVFFVYSWFSFAGKLILFWISSNGMLLMMEICGDLQMVYFHTSRCRCSRFDQRLAWCVNANISVSVVYSTSRFEWQLLMPSD